MVDIAVEGDAGGALAATEHCQAVASADALAETVVDPRAEAEADPLADHEAEALAEPVADTLTHEFDELCDKAYSLQLLDDHDYDVITDAVAGGTVYLSDAVDEIRSAVADFEQGGDPIALSSRPLFALSTPPSSPCMARTVFPISPLPEPAMRIAVVLDTHYLQVATKAFSLASSSWSVTAFEAAILAACGGTGAIVKRYACDSSIGGTSNPLHVALRTAGYELILSPPKPSNGMQGATDVDVACCIFAVAGAFASQPVADTLVLVAGDSDFRPALASVLAAGRALQVAIIAEGTQVGRSCGSWRAPLPAVRSPCTRPALAVRAPCDRRATSLTV